MPTEVYKVGERDKPKNKRRRRLIWLIILLIVILLSIWAFFFIRSKLKPDVVIKQSHAVVSKVNYDQKTKHYDEPDFSVDVPTAWQLMPRPHEPYQTYTWQASSQGTNGQQMVIYEDTIPATYAVNRVLIVHAEGDHVVADGVASDNCSKYTIGAPPAGQYGAPAKWQDVQFLCDQRNTARDVIGTSSTDGVNTVIVKSPDTGASHKFFFAMTNQNYADPDYSSFYTILNSFKVQ